jgi:3-oxoacyl-[acyl-carrier-protein] synthase-1
MAEIVVLGIGLMTPVGLSAAETAASVRAGTTRFTQTNFRGVRGLEPVSLAEVPDDGLPDLAVEENGLTSREMRLLRLATLPLLEALKAAGTSPPKPPLMLALPEIETLKPLDAAKFLTRLAKQTGDAFDPTTSRATQRGRAGGLLAIQEAAKLLQSGTAGRILVGGVDTFRDLFVLGLLEKHKRLKSSWNADGFIPGEGAAFLLLGTPKSGQTLAKLSAIAEGKEEGHLFSAQPYKGEGLAGACEKLLAAEPLPPIQEIYSSMNGESHWAKEWGVAYLRHSKAFSPDARIHHPADCFGDLGAACGPVLIGLATLGMKQGYRRSPCLVYASSDQGPRAVLTATV